MYHLLGTAQLRTLRIAIAALLGTLVAGQHPEAQGLSFSLFERYLDSFRVEAGIPALSGTILQGGVAVWEKGFGRRDVDATLPAGGDTPYLIGGLSQTIGSALLLRKCVDQQGAAIEDAVADWMPSYPEPLTTLGQLLSHTAPGGGGYQYSPARFAALTGVIERCAEAPYRELLVTELLDRFAMADSAPDQIAGVTTAENLQLFDAAHIAHYRGVIGRMAVPYRVVNGRTQRSNEIVPRPADAADGIISSVRDLARFDALLNTTALLAGSTRNLAWTQVFAGTTPLPTGLGWFVQNYNGEPIVWQFGLIRGGYSSLIIKAPNRGISMILLANSDALSAPFSLDNGDVTTSIYARLFLRFFVP